MAIVREAGMTQRGSGGETVGPLHVFRRGCDEVLQFFLRSRGASLDCTCGSENRGNIILSC